MVDQHRPRILIVDDEEAVRGVIDASLRRTGHDELMHADSVAAARRQLEVNGPFGLVILDIRMPGEDGIALLRELAPKAPRMVTIMATGLGDIDTAVQVLKAGAYDYLLKPLSPDAVQLSVARALRKRMLELGSLERRERIEQEVRDRTQALEATRHALLMGLCHMAEFRHDETGAHLWHMAEYARALALDMAQYSPYADTIDERFVAAIVESAPLHDIGKVAVPDRVLLKEGKLTPDEFEEVKLHTVSGRDICLAVKKNLEPRQSTFVDMAVEVTYSHHERWDGKGYPEGLAGAATPLASRIVHVADFFDACRSVRVYRPQPIPLDDVVGMVMTGSGSDFDPHVVDSFKRNLEQILAIEGKYES